MRRVIIESPYGCDVGENLRYLRACMSDCIRRGETPYASHGLLAQEGVLDDNDPTERERGIRAGFEWRKVAHATIFYIDRGGSRGMRDGLVDAIAVRKVDPFHEIEIRRLGWAGLSDAKREGVNEFLVDVSAALTSAPMAKALESLIDAANELEIASEGERYEGFREDVREALEAGLVALDALTYCRL